MRQAPTFRRGAFIRFKPSALGGLGLFGLFDGES